MTDPIDYKAVQRYFDDAADGASAAASYMAHDQDLPPSALDYRFEVEQRTIADWLDVIPSSATVLDVGCGAGAWTSVFANRFDRVVGIEGSTAMVEAARECTRNAPNVSIVHGDVRVDLPDGEFQLVFLGGLCMYLNDDDVVALLADLKGRTGKFGSIILRESTVPHNRRTATGDYQAVYRTPDEYRALFEQAGFTRPDTRRNYGYTSMEIAIELVSARRKWLPFLPRESTRLGTLTWNLLRLTSPISLWALPRTLSRLDVTWPGLQNHFFRLNH
ncbi:MAG: class I SAM-dependent methyltransferase [Planctomycetota bacterium]|nr:class I SAM-dependent methyltransferase [Planctomycetota bacterium]